MNEQGQSDPREPFWARRSVKVGAAVVVGIVLVLLLSRGWRTSSASKGVTKGTPEGEAARQNQLFDIAIRDLFQPDVFDSEERVEQALDRLNQWLQAQKPPADWSVDPMAASLVKTLGSFAEYVKPVDALLTAPGHVLELKEIARRFEPPVTALEDLSKRASFAQLDELARQYEAALRQIDDAARQLDEPAKMAELEVKIQQQFVRRVLDPARMAAFGVLMELGRQLDYSGRLRDPARLRSFALALERLAATHQRKLLEDLVATYEECIRLYSDGLTKTKLSTQFRFILSQLDGVRQMQDLAEYRGLSRILADLAERLRVAAKRTEREELRELAAKADEARRKQDVAALAGLAARLRETVKPTSLDDLKDAAGKLPEGVKRLTALAGRIDQVAGKANLENLPGLSAYVGLLARQIEAVSNALATPPPSADPRKLAQELDNFNVQYAGMTMRVRRLARELDYFATIGAMEFPPDDALTLREAIVLRDLSRWARGEEADGLSRAKRLFDWVVRNIQLEPEKLGIESPSVLRIMKRPWETLFWGSGPAAERAWVFILLTRQQGLDAAMLAIEDSSDASRPRLRPWAVGVLSEGELYLFDPGLGLPIPAPNGTRLDESGQLDIQPATLAQVAGDDSLLRRMDIDGEHRYPVQASQLKKVVALVEGSPAYLTQRMRLVESRLVGEDRLVLAAAPTAQAERLRACKPVAEVRLWSHPDEAWLQRSHLGDEALRWQALMLMPFQLGPEPALWKGRTLHLKGKFLGESSATSFYQMARPSDRELAAADAMDPSLKLLYTRAKQNASFWLGLMAFEQGNYRSALDYLKTRTLETLPKSPWTPAAKYSLGRVYETQKDYRKAIEQYWSNTDSAEYPGNVLRARWLAQLTKSELPAAPPKIKVPEKGLPKLPALPDLPGLPDEKVPAKKEDGGGKKDDIPSGEKPNMRPEKKAEAGSIIKGDGQAP